MSSYLSLRRSIVSLMMGSVFALLLAIPCHWAGSLNVVHAEENGDQDLTPVIKTSPGFAVEQVYLVPKDFGSWVSLTSEKDGKLIASDQYGKLYRITPASEVAQTKVQPLEIPVGRAQGLLYAFDSLYVMAHSGDNKPSGMYRATDTNDDGQYDNVELLLKINGDGEHGPHAIILSPDKQSLYICAGNHTDLPKVDSSALPQTWDEDQVLPRMWDAGGHAVGKVAPGGWICKVDPDGKNLKLIAAGFRNEYDIAFNTAGELFTYDADMEWDVGTPWYRPTRVNHAVSGAEFGWRSGTGKWPSFYPDSLGSVIDIGPGSPTGIAFGTGAKFPEKYQRSLFISDWSYGVIYAIDMTEDGATYQGQSELFCSAPAMQVADMVVLPSDGQLYFVVGGRRTQSSLYRVKYVGEESTAPAPVLAINSAMKSRRELELLHQKLEGDAALTAVEKVWPFLSDDDRNIRYAARIALEHQPAASWANRLAKISDAETLLQASLAVVRNRMTDQKDVILGSLVQLDWAKLSPLQKLALLRVYGLASVRLENFAPTDWTSITAQVRPGFPTGTVDLDRELARLLIAASDAESTATVLQLLKKAPTQEEQIHYAMCLSNATQGWTTAMRESYLGWFVDSANLRGGNSFGGFIKNIRDQAIAKIPMDSLPAQDKKALEDAIARQPTMTDPQGELKARPVVKKWTLEDILPLTEQKLVGRDFENGQKVFAVTQCFKCHRFAGNGGMVGPDLSAAGRRFNKHDLVQSLVDPSAVVSDQYQATLFQLEDGRVVSGRVVNLNGDSYMVQEDMLDPGRLTGINVNQIEEQKPSEVSMMPTGLLDTLTQDDVLDLLAYLRSGGDPSFEELTQPAPQESQTPGPQKP